MASKRSFTSLDKPTGKYEGRQNSPEGWSVWSVIVDKHLPWWQTHAESDPNLIQIRELSVATLTRRRLKDALVECGLVFYDGGGLCSGVKEDTDVTQMVKNLAELIGLKE